VSTASIKLWGENVGAVTWLKERGYAAFEYEPSFLVKGIELSPIHLSVADGKAGRIFSFPNLDRETFRGLPGLLANSLPDDFGNKVIDSWLAKQGRQKGSFNPVERLCYIGGRGMGALEFIPSIAPKNLNNSVSIEVRKLLDLAQDVLAERNRLDVRLDVADKDKADAMLDILRVGVSAGGAVPKAVIAINDEGNIVSGQTEAPEGYEHWIIKFDGVSPDAREGFGKSTDSCRVEYAYYLMAKEAGINMTDCRLLEENGRAHFLTKRFDRHFNEKFHTLTLAAIGHLGWNPPGTVGYESAFQVMRTLRLPYAQQEQQFRRMVFNAIAGNQDDHVKQISYLMDRSGQWQLSPAYDMTFSYNPDDGLGEIHKMTINGRQDGFVFDDFIDVAYNMEINKAEIIVDEILDVVTRWPDFASQAQVSPDVQKYVGSLHLNENSLDHGPSVR
jgi:serine/threonine-protein kinase HipA